MDKDALDRIMVVTVIAGIAVTVGLLTVAVLDGRRGRAELGAAMDRLEQYRASVVPRSVFDPAEQL